VHGRRHKRYLCRSCRHQATLTAGTIMEATKLPLTIWFLAFYLVGQAKTGISSMALMRHLPQAEALRARASVITPAG
jgi:transposase-like protein